MVVRRGIGESEEQQQKQNEIELKLKNENKERLKEKKEQEERKRVEEAELERQERELEERQMIEKEKDKEKKEKDAVLRKKALDEAKEDAEDKINSDDTFGSDKTDSLLVKAAEESAKIVMDDSEKSEIQNQQEKALLTAVKHKSWLEERQRAATNEAITDVSDETQDLEFDRIFGPGAAQEAAQLEIEFQEDKEDATVEDGDTPWETSTPKRRRPGGRRRLREGLNINISPLREGSEDSAVSRIGVETWDPDSNENKKFKLDEDEEVSDEQDMSQSEDEGSKSLEEEKGEDQTVERGDKNLDGGFKGLVKEVQKMDIQTVKNVVERDMGDGNIQLPEEEGNQGVDQGLDMQGHVEHQESQIVLASGVPDVGQDGLVTGKGVGLSEGEGASSEVVDYPDSPSVGGSGGS